MSKKKSYNPFKMWGSWIGVGIAVINIIIVILFAGDGQFKGDYKLLLDIIVAPLFLSAYPYILLLKMLGGESGIIAIPVMIIGGFVNLFLLGWGVHSLVRRLRK